MIKLGLVAFVVIFCLIVVLLLRSIVISNKKETKKIVLRFSFFMHPNAITIWGGLTSIAGMILYYFDYPDLGVTLYIVGVFADMLDGIVARELELITPFGKKLDPFMDKIKYFIPLAYFAFEGMLSWKLVLLFMVVDISGQYLRNAVHIIQKIGLCFATAANNFGKTKAASASVLVIYCFLLKQHIGLPDFADYTLSGIVVLAMLSVAFKFTRSKKSQVAEVEVKE